VSGDFSVGAEGLMVQVGEFGSRSAIDRPTLQRMLLDIVHVGADLEWPGGAAGMTCSSAT
jgi:hypothetical protein